MFSKWHKNLIPAPLGSETHLSMAQWGSVLGPEASPHHYRAATMWSHLLNAVLTESLSWSPPDQNGMEVRALKAEPGLISEDDLGPLLMCPLSMIPAPALLSSFVGRCQLWSLCWATGAEVGSMHAVPQGLCGILVWVATRLMQFAADFQDAWSCLVIWSSMAAVFLGLSGRGLFWTWPVVLKRCCRLTMADGDT